MARSTGTGGDDGGGTADTSVVGKESSSRANSLSSSSLGGVTSSCSMALTCSAFLLVSLCTMPFGLMYGYSVLVIPIQSIFTPSEPYALSESHAVWALAGSLLMSGAALYFLAGCIRLHPKATLIISAVAGALGLALQGAAMDLAQDHRMAAIAIYYVGQVAFFGPVCGSTFLLAIFASLAWFSKLCPTLPGLGSGLIGPSLAVETAVLVWMSFGFNNRLGRGDLCEPPCDEGRLDVFFFVAAAIIGGSLLGAAHMWRLPSASEPAAARPNTVSRTPSSLSSEPSRAKARVSLTAIDVARTRTFWSFFTVFFLTLTPGFGLKLMSSPVVYFTYGFSAAGSNAFTCFYLACYGVGRLCTPIMSRGKYERARKIYMAYSLASACLLLVSPATINGLPSRQWPSPLLFCILVATQGFFLGGFKGLMPTSVQGLWCWMDGDRAYKHYDPIPAYDLVLGMTNLALCTAAAVGPVTAWVAYVAPADANAKQYEIWYYAAGALQLVATAILATPGVVRRFEPPPRVNEV